MGSLTAARAGLLRPLLEDLLAQRDPRARVAFDPIELPHRYARREDIEVSALLASALAYGRVELFKPKVVGLLERMGRSPADFAAHFDPQRDRAVLEGFVYRFNLAADLGVLLAGMGALLRSKGSLGAAFEVELPLQEGLSRFAAALRGVPQAPIVRALGPTRGLDHLLPEPTRGGSCKRLLLFLRWMVRPADGVDFGLWPMSPAKLVIPLDTHIARISRLLGLTARTDLSWRTAEEVTASLRRLDPLDPVKYDFALCHYGISGLCPTKPARQSCAVCTLRPACRTGTRLVGR